MASRFNFNAIALTDAADITKIAENFNKIDEIVVDDMIE